MPKRINLLVAACIALAGFAQDPPKPSAIAIMDLKGQATENWGNPTDQVTQVIGGAFMKTRKFELLERAQLEKVMREAKRQNQATSGFDDSQAAELGKLAGAKMVVVGNFSAAAEYTPAHTEQGTKGPIHYDAMWSANITSNFRLINIETGKVIESFTIKGSSLHNVSIEKAKSETLMDLGRKTDREVANRYPVTGYVIKVISEKEYLLDLGKNANIAEGDKFVVVERAADIVHPVTGKIIKGEKKTITELKATEIQEETCIVKITGTKVALKLGAAVESLPKKAGFGESFSDFFKN